MFSKSVCAVALVCGLTAFAETWDVVVVGGTTRAVEAAVAAKKAGAKTLLVAPHPLLSDDAAGQLRLDAYENPEAAALPEHFRLKREDVTNYPFATLTPNVAKYAAMLALQSNAVPFRLATAVTDIVRDASGANVLQTFDRGGEGSLVAKAVIDATGFTALGEKAGVEFAPFKPGKHRFVRYVMNGTNTAFASDVEVKEFQNYWYAVIPGWDVKAPTNFPGFFKVQLFRCTWETDMKDDSPLTLAKIDSAFRDRTFGPLQADAGDQFFAEKPLRPFVSGEAAEDLGFFWCADEAGAAAKAAAKAAAYAKASGAKEGAAKFSDEWPVLATADVVVAGGGTCGSPAAIAAARAGAKVVLCEFYFNLGGTQTTGLLGKYWDGNRVGFTTEIDAGVKKLGSILNQTKAEYYRQEIVKAGGTVFYGTRVVGAVIEGEDAKGRPLVRGVKVVTADGRKGVIRAAVTVDATGNADVAAAAGAPTVFGAQREEAPVLQGTSISWRDIACSVVNYEVTYVDDTDPESIRRGLWQTTVDYGTYRWDLSPFIGSRERRHIVGDFVVRTHDMAREKKYRDTITYCKAGQDSHGVFSDEMLFFTTISGSKKHFAPVPYRALFPAKVAGMLVTGLGISAERDALAVMRMQADLQNEGYAAGRAAAMAAKAKCALEDVDIRALQRHLVEKGLFDESVLTHEDTPPMNAKELSALLPSVLTNANLVGIWEFFAAGETGKAVVADAAKRPSWKPGSDEARNFALLETALGVPGGEAELVRFLGTIDAATTNVWDKGCTSAICYGSRFSVKDEAIIALAKAKYAPFGPKLAEMMKSLPDDAPYSHLRAIAIYLDAVPEKSCAPELARILKAVKGHAQSFDDGNMPKFPKKQIHPQARELMTARALYRLGDADGLAKGVLESYLNDPVKVMADFARRALGCAEKKAGQAAGDGLCEVTAEVQGPAGDTQFHLHGAGAMLVNPDDETDLVALEGEPVRVKARKYLLKSTSDDYTLEPAELDLTGKTDASVVVTFVKKED